MAMTIPERVMMVVAETAGIDEGSINQSTNLVKELALDSLDVLDLTFNLEREFNIKDLSNAFQDKAPQTVEELVRLIQNEFPADA